MGRGCLLEYLPDVCSYGIKDLEKIAFIFPKKLE